jgi:hypothetical protein
VYFLYHLGHVLINPKGHVLGDVRITLRSGHLGWPSTCLPCATFGLMHCKQGLPRWGGHRTSKSITAAVVSRSGLLRAGCSHAQNQGHVRFTPQQRHTSVSDCSQSSSAVRFERMRQFYRRIVQRCSIAVEKLVPRAKNERSVRDCAAIAH